MFDNLGWLDIYVWYQYINKGNTLLFVEGKFISRELR